MVNGFTWGPACHDCGASATGLEWIEAEEWQWEHEQQTDHTDISIHTEVA